MIKGKVKIFCLLAVAIISLNICSHANKLPEKAYNSESNICNSGYEEAELPPPSPCPEFH